MRYFKLIDEIEGLTFFPGKILGLDENNKIYENINKICDFINPSILHGKYFREIKPRFKNGDHIRLIQSSKDKYGKVIAVDPYNWQIGILFDDATTIYFGMDYPLISHITPYWFINSEGKYCKVIEEKTDPRALNYRKSIGNYFQTKEEAAEGVIYTKFDNNKHIISLIKEKLNKAGEIRKRKLLDETHNYWDGVIDTCEQLLKYLNHESDTI